MRGLFNSFKRRVVQACRDVRERGKGERYKSDASLDGLHFGVRPEEAQFQALVVHGLLGHGRNWRTFCRRMLERAETFAPGAWSIFAVDLRNHGKSAQQNFSPPHSIGAAAKDVLKMYSGAADGRAAIPDLLIGHSFGGKVVLSCLDQLAKQGAKAPDASQDHAQGLPFPRQVWVLDSMIGKAPASSEASDVGRVLDEIGNVQLPVASREDLYKQMEAAGFSLGLRQWMGSNLIENRQLGGLEWMFNLAEARDMYRSYQNINLWSIVKDAPRIGVRIHVVRGEKSDRWSEKAVKQLEEAAQSIPEGHLKVHMLPNAGHWVHADNPQGLLDMIEPAMQQIGDTKQR